MANYHSAVRHKVDQYLLFADSLIRSLLWEVYQFYRVESGTLEWSLFLIFLERGNDKKEKWIPNSSCDLVFDSLHYSIDKVGRMRLGKSGIHHNTRYSHGTRIRKLFLGTPVVFFSSSKFPITSTFV